VHFPLLLEFSIIFLTIYSNNFLRGQVKFLTGGDEAMLLSP